MSVFRVEKNTNYTVMSNYHLRDKRLNLRTIGLLSLILSLPQDWDYSQAGLVAICKDGPDSVAAGLKQLEDFGYLERSRERDAKGRVHGVVYRVYEAPKDIIQKDTSSNCDLPKQERPKQEIPKQVNPNQEILNQDFPTLGKQSQINKELQNTDMINHPSIYQSRKNEIGGKVDGSTTPTPGDIYKGVIAVIEKNVNLDFFEYQSERADQLFDDAKIELFEYEEMKREFNAEEVKKIIRYVADVIVSESTEPMKIGGELISRDIVKSKLMKVDMLEMKRVLNAINKNPNIKNPKSYAISMLYNA